MMNPSRRPRGRDPGIGCAALLGALGACAGSMVFGAVLMGIGTVEIYSTAAPATARGPVGDWAFASLVVGAFAFLFAVAPGILGGIFIALTQRRLAQKGVVSTRQVAINGLAVGAAMGVLLVIVFLVYQTADVRGVTAPNALAAVAGMILVSAVTGMVVALVFSRAGPRLRL